MEPPPVGTAVVDLMAQARAESVKGAGAEFERHLVPCIGGSSWHRSVKAEWIVGNAVSLHCSTCGKTWVTGQHG